MFSADQPAEAQESTADSGIESKLPEFQDYAQAYTEFQDAEAKDYSANVGPESTLEVVTQSDLLKIDRIRAGFVGLALGNALGLPHEAKRHVDYTGSLYAPYRHSVPFKGTKVLAVGQYSAPTELTLTLARSIVAVGGYDPEFVVENYIYWADSDPIASKSLKNLFRGNIRKDPRFVYVKRRPKKGKKSRGSYRRLAPSKDPTGYDKYRSKFLKQYLVQATDYFQGHSGLSSDKAEAAQNNDSLIRCFPLACLPEAEFQSAVTQDIWCTNPSATVLAGTWIYLNCIRLALGGLPAAEIWEYAANAGISSENSTIKDIFQAVVSSQLWDLVLRVDSGVVDPTWMGFGLYVAMACLQALASEAPPSWSSLMSWIIKDHPESKAGSNAAIAGALIGSILGWEKLIADPVTRNNIGVMIVSTSRAETDMPRDPIFQLLDLENVVEALATLDSNLDLDGLEI